MAVQRAAASSLLGFPDRLQERTEVTEFTWPPSRTVLTRKQRTVLGAELKRRYDDEGASTRELAAVSGRSYGFVNEVLKEAGARMRRPGRPAQGVLSGRQLKVLRLLAEGETPETIGVELGVGAGTVHSHLARMRRRIGAGKGNAADPAAVEIAYATALLPPPAREGRSVELPDSQRKLILLLARGMSVKHIAAVLGRSSGAVYGDLREVQKVLGALSPAHVITRARQYGLATSAAVCICLPKEGGR